MNTIRPRHVPITKVVIHEKEIAAVSEVLRSGNLREGEQCRAFEEEFATAVGSRFALTVSSGTAALQMLYQALLEPGDEVLVPAFSFFATASMVSAVGAVPIFCDIRPDTLTIDLEDAAGRISPRTKALVPVHIFGNPANVSAAVQLAEAHNLRIIWDAAQAHGSRYRDRDVGSFDEAVAYSFYPSKNMTTGEGGMICANDADLLARLQLLRSQGLERKHWHTTLGYNFRLTDFQAALGRGQLRHVQEWVERRRENAAYLRERLSGTELIQLQSEEPNGFHSYHQFSILLDPKIDRSLFMKLLAERGVETAIHYPTPLHQQPFFASLTGNLSLEVAEDTCRRIVSLPVHPHLTEDDRVFVAGQVLEVLEVSRSG